MAAATLPSAAPAAPRRLLSPAAWHDLLGLLFVALALLVAGKLAVRRPATAVAMPPPAAVCADRGISGPTAAAELHTPAICPGCTQHRQYAQPTRP